MPWIKRNLLFLIGAVVAVILLGLGGWYLYAKSELNSANLEELNKAYAELERIAGLNPNPGNSKTDNIALAKEQQARVRDQIRKVGRFFTPIPPIPAGANVTSEAFSAALRRTVVELVSQAGMASVGLPPKNATTGASYNFSFDAQRNLVKFASGSLPALSSQLGEIKTICGVLYAARINSLDGIRRERVSTDDSSGAATDYLDGQSVTNELGVLTPYEVTFRCFSPELAGVLGGLASDPHGLLVKTINVEPAPPSSAPASDASGAMGAYSQGFAGSRYLPGGGNPYAAAAAPSGVPAVGAGGLPILLDEKPLKVTMVVNVLKLQPRK
jgi:hypothetical protein